MLFHDPDQALRAALWRRFAVMDGTHPRHCQGPRGDFDKIVFESADRARGAATELVRLGNVQMYPHPCKTGGVKHWHLTRTPQKEQEGQVGLVQQRPGRSAAPQGRVRDEVQSQTAGQ